MRIRLLTSAAIALSLVATPVLANPAARLSVANSPQVRASSNVDGKSRLTGSAWIGVVAALAVGAGAVVLALTTDDDDSDSN
ncbi:hypothetical protein LZK98_10220 [Sphingomonas cannabina]|uniref:hypothetical protein n=1 Tax=Sphingomonas cannabina TaxID=2899123 RepID=UPI001F41791F|nr:hypothetical protein [Sphingomonas cannabina]UIJ47280.1 hypothetical protein LZK98_10220 [Sphingomonas cannabina]